MPKIFKVRKRDGRIEKFDPEKISSAIHKALVATKTKDGILANKLSSQVVAKLEKISGIPDVEQIQDIVEDVLMDNKLPNAAKAYILYRNQKSEIRQYKEFFGVVDDLKLGINAIKVLERRYLLKDSSGKVIETPSQLFRRVAKAVAKPDLKYDKKGDVEKTEEEFYEMMANLEFMPNSPTLMNAGTELGQLSACFVIPIEDSLSSIFDAVKISALIHQSGGGTGFSFSKLRPKGDIVKSTGGVASGPISFMKVFDSTTNEIKQGGKRRGANMGILRVDHPDILDFITSKSKQNMLTNFNISVAVTDEFMRKAVSGEDYDLINPRSGRPVKRLNARDVLNLIVTLAWETGDPGMIFIVEINRTNPTSHLGKIESTNPCGEQPLHPFESCVLGSINLSKFVDARKINWEKLKETIRKGVHFLDNVIDANKYPIEEIQKITLANRRIGLGVMGFADALIKMGIQYDSESGLKTAEQIMKFLEQESHNASIELAKKRGSFPNFKGSKWEKKGYTAIRNATVTTIAPTGTISIIAGCSSGIEPLFAIAFVRNVMEGTRLLEINPIFEETATSQHFYSHDLITRIARVGTIQDFKEIPPQVKKLFRTALDIDPEWHVRMQATFQMYTDNAVSKTINLRSDSSVEDVKKSYLLAWKLKCKGITIFRYGSKPQQVLYIGSLEKEVGDKHVAAESEFAGGCPTAECAH